MRATSSSSSRRVSSSDSAVVSSSQRDSRSNPPASQDTAPSEPQSEGSLKDFKLALLQSFLAKPAFKKEEIGDLCNKLLEALNVQQSGSLQLKTILQEINADLRKLFMEVVEIRDQESGIKYYGLQNTFKPSEGMVMDKYSKLQQSQSQFFIKIIDELFLQKNLDQRWLSENEAISLQAQVRSDIKPKMNPDYAQTTLELLIKDGWLQRRNDPENPSKRIIVLGIRSQIDLRSLIDGRFKDQQDEIMTKCCLCDLYCLMGQRCNSDDCSVALHYHCASALEVREGQRKCPKCPISLPDLPRFLQRSTQAAERRGSSAGGRKVSGKASTSAAAAAGDDDDDTAIVPSKKSKRVDPEDKTSSSRGDSVAPSSGSKRSRRTDSVPLSQEPEPEEGLSRRRSSRK